MNSSYFKLALALGLLSAIGPFAIDMYLPALPSIGQSLHADAATVQLSLTVFFVAVGCCQLFYGPLSDLLGRKLPLYLGLVLFGLGSLGCALAHSAPVFIACRFLQGLGACGGMVIPRAIVRDLHSGVEAARLMSLIMLVFSISPLLAPLTGSFIIQAVGWRAVFWTVLGAAVLGLGIIVPLKETRPPAARAASSLHGTFVAYGRLVRDLHFLGIVCVGTFGMASFFLYLANSPFVMIEHYHLSPRAYSVLFSLNAGSFFAAAQLNHRLGARFGLRRLVRSAATGFALVMLLLLALFAAGVDHLAVLTGLLMLAYACLGMTVPPSSVLALDEHGAIAGTASALMGTVQFGVGSVVMAVSGGLTNGAPLPMVAGIAACALLCVAFARISLREQHPAAVSLIAGADAAD